MIEFIGATCSGRRGKSFVAMTAGRGSINKRLMTSWNTVKAA
jgi:hypothetical protein